jgi:hypothetical protein
MTWDKAMTDILRFAALALGLLAGSLLTDKDPLGAIQRHLRQRRSLLLAIISAGFITGFLWEALRG